MGAPATPSGRFSELEYGLGGEGGGGGKTVEKVAIEERFRIRRACTADSWMVGKW